MCVQGTGDDVRARRRRSIRQLVPEPEPEQPEPDDVRARRRRSIRQLVTASDGDELEFVGEPLTGEPDEVAALRAADLDLRRAERIVAGEQVLAEQSGTPGHWKGEIS